MSVRRAASQVNGPRRAALYPDGDDRSVAASGESARIPRGAQTTAGRTAGSLRAALPDRGGRVDPRGARTRPVGPAKLPELVGLAAAGRLDGSWRDALRGGLPRGLGGGRPAGADRPPAGDRRRRLRRGDGAV